jgi:hypothetical protein
MNDLEVKYKDLILLFREGAEKTGIQTGFNSNSLKGVVKINEKNRDFIESIQNLMDMTVDVTSA